MTEARTSRVHERLICRLADWWCSRWVGHTCGRLRFWCNMPSQPFFVRWADRIDERLERQ